MSDTTCLDAAEREPALPGVDWNNVADKAENATLDGDDAPRLTPDTLAGTRPAADVLREMFPSDVAEVFLRKPGRPKGGLCKEKITIRLSPEVVSHFRAQGKGWQSRINDVLRKAIDEQRA